MISPADKELLVPADTPAKVCDHVAGRAPLSRRHSPLTSGQSPLARSSIR